jgi:anti-sigma28 factor (negative regulator of flagellin synthesis)
MPSESSTPIADEANVASPNTLQPPRRDARSRAAAKGAATIQRHKEERRADNLAQIRAQIANGTLVVRQMTIAERKQHPKPLAGHIRQTKRTRGSA